MFGKSWKTVGGMLLALLGIASLALLTTHAAGGGQAEWSTDTLADFVQGTMGGVDVWSDPGAARLDRLWWPNVRVNDDEAESQVYPSLTFVLSNTGGLTETHFLAVWCGGAPGARLWSGARWLLSAPPVPRRSVGNLFRADAVIRCIVTTHPARPGLPNPSLLATKKATHLARLGLPNPSLLTLLGLDCRIQASWQQKRLFANQQLRTDEGEQVF